MWQSQTVRRVMIPVDEHAGASPVTVLVVTPDADLRAAAARAIACEGYRVMTAAHGGHAVLSCLGAGRVDLLATELSMDDVSGPALAERLRRHCPDLVAVYMAGSGTPECEGVLVRPFTKEDLLAALATARAAAEAQLPTSPAS